MSRALHVTVLTRHAMAKSLRNFHEKRSMAHCLHQREWIRRSHCTPHSRHLHLTISVLMPSPIDRRARSGRTFRKLPDPAGANDSLNQAASNARRTEANALRPKQSPPNRFNFVLRYLASSASSLASAGQASSFYCTDCFENSQPHSLRCSTIALAI